MNKLNITIAAAVAACSCGAFAAIRAVTPAEKGDTKFIMPDRLHPNDAGHEIWWNEIAKFLGMANGQNRTVGVLADGCGT